MRTFFKVFLSALAGTWAFFFEYLPPLRSVRLPYDMEGYHFPLFQYAFLSLKQGVLPQWDPSIYGGVSFLANVQTALFYPLTWLMFLSSWDKELLSYDSLQKLQFLQVALAFTLCYLWLSRRHLQTLACVLGAGVFAYSGYLCTQLQHFGLVGTYAWMPLAFIGIDEAAEGRTWKPLWKVTLAATMAFLAGYPPTWAVFAIAAGTYALLRDDWRRAPLLAAGVALCFVLALVICAVQVLPAWEATQFRDPENRYGGIQAPMFFLNYVVPNYYDYAIDAAVQPFGGNDLFYLGAPGIAGVLLAVFTRPWRPILPLAGVVAVSLVFVINPFDVVGSSIRHSTLLPDLLRDYYFLAGAAIGIAGLTAHGLDRVLASHSKPAPPWALALTLLLMTLWIVFDLWRWTGKGFAVGWASLGDTAIALAVFSLALWVLCGERNQRRRWLAVALVIFVGVDYKAFGTSKRFDATAGTALVYSSSEFPAMDPEAFEILRQPSDYRVALHDFGPPQSALRQVGWRSPQGFDPLLTSDYRELGERYGRWVDDRGFSLDLLRPESLQVFGVRYILLGDPAADYPALGANPLFRSVGSDQFYYKVLEYPDAKPVYQLEGGQITVSNRVADHRVLQIASAQGGLLTFAEAWYPGWSALLDGAPLQIEKWEGALQAVRVPAGAHTVEFIYAERLLPLGGAISLAGLALLILHAAAGIAAASPASRLANQSGTDRRYNQ